MTNMNDLRTIGRVLAERDVEWQRVTRPIEEPS